MRWRISCACAPKTIIMSTRRCIFLHWKNTVHLFICVRADLGRACYAPPYIIIMTARKLHGFKNIPAVLIGKTTGQKDRILQNAGEISYLNRPAADEILRF